VPGAYRLTEEGLDYLECLGLLHNIGYVVLLVNFQDRFLDFFTRSAGLDLPDFFSAEREWFDGYDHFTAGAAVLGVWRFPAPLADIVAGYATGDLEFEGEFSDLYNLLRLSRHVIMMTESNFHPRKPADYWLEGTRIPAAEVDYDQIISDVRDSVRSIEASFS
jgi:HD-like signal output (HDOD) protein